MAVVAEIAGLLGGGRVAWGMGSVASSLLFGVVYLVVGRHLWVVVVAHGLIGTVSSVAIYPS